ncbi:ABC transporter permease [Actinobacillus equuli]|uniref:Iron(III) transport system permease n=1 Tax=Actinobacillus equuli TaxID=718 RepID=A0AAX3FJ72_ACTEU|nr:iron ABC transporter permease [Actinobacillus equuli]AIZ79011.1 iron ABC transporter permease [Actinobacillus equuli subsp. equuli]WGE45259.1 iron ABC transporter permease [Actinobacillus equuli subsp. equuli]VEE89088.1 iron(III) transport system permease [Actinobacillus equuli]
MLQRFSHSYFWILLALLAFAYLPSQALDYGLFGATKGELVAAMGWSNVNISWLWFGGLLIFPVFRYNKDLTLRSRIELGLALLLIFFLLSSAVYLNYRFGYAIISLALALLAISSNALANLKVLQADRFMIVSLLVVVLTIALFILYPITTIFSTMFSEGNAFVILEQSYLLRIVWNSLSVSATVGVLSTVLGLCFALYTTRIATKRTRLLSKFFSVLPMVTPPFVVSLGIALMLGRSGYITDFLVEYFGFSANWLYGFTGIAVSHTLALTPMAFMILEGALKSSNVVLEEASYTLRANSLQTFRFVLLPLLKPALANSFLVITVQSLADFSTPFVLGGNFDVLASQIYFYLVGTQLDYAAASGLGAILLGFSLLFFLIQYWWIGKGSYVTVSGKGFRGTFQPLPSGLKSLIFCILAAWVGFTVLLYGSIFYGSFTVNWGVDHSFTLENYRKLFGQGLDQGGFPSLIQTVLFSLIAAPISAVLGLLIAYLLTRHSFVGKQSLEFVTLLCFAVPGTVAGVSYVVAFNHSPLYLTGTAAIIVLSMVTRNMPIGMRACMAALQQLDKSLDEASFSLRVSSLKTLLFVTLPLLKPAFLSALVTSFVRSMTTISAIVFLVSPSTRVATSYILNRVEDGAYGLAVAYGSTLIMVMMLIIGLFGWLMKDQRQF